ncbi:MAG: nuclear transport factor 2 family protein [Bacteroidota bacterium]
MNKSIATGFLRLVTTGKVREAYEKYVSENFIHHNAWFKGDRQSLLEAMEESEKNNPVKIFDIKRMIEEGDLVSVHSHIRMNQDDRGMVVVHIFRFETGKIAELWDVIMPIPEENSNENGVI